MKMRCLGMRNAGETLSVTVKDGEEALLLNGANAACYQQRRPFVSVVRLGMPGTYELRVPTDGCFFLAAH